MPSRAVFPYGSEPNGKGPDGPGPGRRSLVAGGGAAALAASGLLAGCGPGGGEGKRDRFRAAFTAGGSQESLDPHVAPNFVDQARAKALFDTLATYDDEMAVRKRLAESWESDSSGLRWRIRLREASFHDGAPVTAKDVLYSYRRAADPKTGSPSQQLLSAVDFGESRARGRRELTLVLKRPDFEFPTAFAGPGTEIVPEGTTSFRHPVGSGPFRYVSFRPGGIARLRRWEGHWSGAPRLGELEIVPANEESARVNALLSGQVHYAADISGAFIDRLERARAVEVLTSKQATAQQLLLRTGRSPFDDPKLVEAVLLGVDREALVRVALAGRGGVGSDLFGKGLRGYPPGLPERERDVARARKLVREAGADGLAFTLETSTVDASWESAATLISRQLREVGLRVTPHTRASATYFSEIQDKGVAALNTTSTLPVSDFLQQRLRSRAARNLTGFRSGRFDELMDRARSIRDEQDRLRLLYRAQRIAREKSGMLVWGFSDANDAIASSVRGLRAAAPNSHAWARFDDVELS
ncbi:peptide/nickel transport system substrate-binding protein [Streptomyces sp. Amel2xB2]|uniref:ABC transporter substrate-binding protein n=1 Tax=Streptomyces sp. Amel2xB2 TaxID=1305829 RepID=UPI000DC03719|nr:ABC transporter substrate-binding protein [Streptomyces sp. Amel2xB2]RAJ68832.1 peptide/nickel transport system substrate-binding protein [Streptomyces sp. Amel2xB2]